MSRFARPSPENIARFLDRQRGQPFSYPGPGSSRTGEAPPGFVVDHRRRELGLGEQAFEAARAAVRDWVMFRLGWVEICRPLPPIETGTAVAVLARFAGVWWLNACRIVYVVDESAPLRRFGFAYGTLPDHAESGEERFTVEWREDDSVWYDLYAYSRPGTWLVRLGYPVARHLQKRFGVDSLAVMERAVREGTAAG
jgi:uncharacterized protein (UPF0548 family)